MIQVHGQIILNASAVFLSMMERIQDSRMEGKQLSFIRKAQELTYEVNQVILGKEELVLKIMAAFLAGGHVLLEDVPGVGKTTMALAFSKAMGINCNRMQFTPDVLPSDITGFSLYRKDLEQFIYQPGVVFCNLFLADEINRASPKTQSALLEVMEEQQVTVDGVSRPVPDPFWVIATQNPSGTVGTQMLPPAQVDRFMVCMSMGYPDFQSEVALAKGQSEASRVAKMKTILQKEEIVSMQREVQSVYMHDVIYQYIVRLIAATRRHPNFEMGVSPRGTLALSKMSQATAWLKGYNYVSPHEVANQFIAVATHRVQLSTKAQMENQTKEGALQEILSSVEQPNLQRMAQMHG